MKNLHLLPTENSSRLVKIYNDVNRETFTLKLDVEVNDSFKEYVNVYITSNEEIKDGERHLHYYEGKHVISKSYNSAVKVINEIAEQFGYKKIILTTDQDLIKDGVQEIDDEFLEWFVKNPSCDEIEVNWVKTPDGIFYHKDNIPYGCYKIITPKEEMKQETLEEASKNYGKIRNELDYGQLYCNSVDSFKSGAKWQQEQDKNLYSEEDMIEFADFYYQYKELIKLEKWEIIEISKKDVFKKWFEQYKKNKS